MREMDRFIDLLNPHSRTNPVEPMPEEKDILPEEEQKEMDRVYDDGEEEDCFCGVTYPGEDTEDDEDSYMDDSFDDDEEDIPEDEYGFRLPPLPYPKLPPFASKFLTKEHVVNQYVQVEFEVKDEFKPAFKTILSIMRIFKDEFLPYSCRVEIIDGLVKNINLQSKKINWTGWHETLTKLIMTEEQAKRKSLKALCDLSIDNLKSHNVPIHSIETKVIPASYFERERLNREFLDCFQEDEGTDCGDIIVPSWKELAGSTYDSFIKVVNVRKDPQQEDGNENVYCKIQFNINHQIKPLYKKVGQFIGTFGPYTSIYENPLIPALKAYFKIGDESLDEHVELVICRDGGISTSKIFINGFEDVEDNIQIFRKELRDLPDEVILPLQDINRLCNFDMTIKLKPELFEGAELLNNYLIFKRQKQYVSTRDTLSEIFNLLLQETSVTKNYITREMGTSLNGYMYAEESDMDEFADTLPPHLRKLVKEVYTDIFPSEPPEEALGLHGDLYEMLGFITDIEKLQFHFSPKPFETDDENEPEIMEKVNIEINMSLVGTTAQDVHQHLKEIEGKTAEVDFVAKYIKN